MWPKIRLCSKCALCSGADELYYCTAARRAYPVVTKIEDPKR